MYQFFNVAMCQLFALLIRKYFNVLMSVRDGKFAGAHFFVFGIERLKD